MLFSHVNISKFTHSHHHNFTVSSCFSFCLPPMALFPSNPSAPSQLPNGNVIHHPLSPFPSFSLSRSGWISLPWLVEQMQISWTNADKATASPLSFNQCSDPQAYTDTHTHTRNIHTICMSTHVPSLWTTCILSMHKWHFSPRCCLQCFQWSGPLW